MKIAYFVWEYFPRLVGGLGTYAVEITKKFEELGHDVVVFTQNTGELKTYEEWRGIEIHRPLTVDLCSAFPLFVTEDLRRWGSSLKFFCDIFSYNHLSASKLVNQLIRKEGRHFDLVAIHDWLSSIAGLILKEEIKDLPVAFHIHSTEEQRTGGGGSAIIKHLEKIMTERADVLITVSYAMKEHLIALGYPAQKIRVCWNGADPDKYDPAKVDPTKVSELKKRYNIRPDENVILFIGRLTWMKGVHNLVQAMPSILAKFPKTKLVILGKGEAYDDLVHLSERMNVRKNIIFRSEWVSEEERVLHYAMSDVCVFPSISEPFGIVSLEAMAMEKPVVVGAGGISGFREQVVPSGPDQCGIHVNGNNPADIAWGILTVLEKPEEAKRLGRNGRERVKRHFSWRKVAEDTLAVYEELIKR